MQVIFVNRFFFPDEAATSRLISSLAADLAKLHWDVQVITSRRFHNGSLMPAIVNPMPGVTVHRIWSSSFGASRLIGRGLEYLTFHATAWLRIRRLARSQTPVVIVACTDPPLLSITAMLATWRSRAILVNSIRDLFPEAAIFLGVLRAQSVLARSLCWLRDLSLRKARWNVAVSPRMATALLSRGTPSSTVEVIYDWSEGDAIWPIDRTNNKLLREWGLSDKFVVGYSGNLGRVHEFGTILDTAERLRDRNQIVFLFVGEGYWRDWVESEAHRRGLQNVLMKPLQPRERLAESLSIPDLHLVSLLPALEPCSIPSKLYGILAAGRPTLFVGDLDGEVARIIAEGSCGTAFAIGDSDGLAQKILDLSMSDTSRYRMGENARRVFERRFTREIGIEKWHRLLQASLPLEARQGLESAPIAPPRGRAQTTL